jgi:hypothetical protein
LHRLIPLFPPLAAVSFYIRMLAILTLPRLNIPFWNHFNAGAVFGSAQPSLPSLSVISRYAHVLLVWRVAKALFGTPIGDFLV